MNKATLKKTAIFFQILVLLVIQLNAVAPQMLRLFPALAVGDLGECHCSMDCRCSRESRQTGVCCCKQANKLKLKLHCKSQSRSSKEASLRSCPCGDTSPHSLVSPESQVFIASCPVVAFVQIIPHSPLLWQEPPVYHDRRPEPPDPPPKLSPSVDVAAA